MTTRAAELGDRKQVFIPVITLRGTVSNDPKLGVADTKSLAVQLFFSETVAIYRATKADTFGTRKYIDRCNSLTYFLDKWKAGGRERFFFIFL